MEQRFRRFRKSLRARGKSRAGRRPAGHGGAALLLINTERGIFKAQRLGGDLRSFVRRRALAACQWKADDGTTVEGMLLYPPGKFEQKNLPMFTLIHGGPADADGNHFEADWYQWDRLAATQGWLVFEPNYRGSTGYGQDYCKAIWADWGNKDFQDDMAMVDYSIGQGIADPEKLGVGGWSYGGISTDFIIGQTKRFKAAISGAGAAEFASMYGHDQYQKDYFTELGYPWESPELWNKLAPFYRVKDITAPTLFMGGNIDWNVPILGGEQMYQALKALGGDTELVVYPDEYHEFTVPSHIEDRLKRYLAWYGHYVKGDAAPATLPQDTSELRVQAADR